LAKWIPVKGYEGLYEISDTGQVKSLINGERILKPQKHTGGYLYVNLYKNKKQTKFYIHRLVASHFLREPRENEEVNHLDGDKENNTLRNLEWTSPAENNQHARNLGLIDNGVRVSQYTIDGRYLKTFNSFSEAARETGLHYPAVKNAAYGFQKSSGGFLWRISDGTRDDLNIAPGDILGTKNNTKEIVQLGGNGNVLNVFKSIREASNITGLGYSAISKCVTGVNKTCGGFVWRYAHEIDLEEGEVV